MEGDFCRAPSTKRRVPFKRTVAGDFLRFATETLLESITATDARATHIHIYSYKWAAYELTIFFALIGALITRNLN